VTANPLVAGSLDTPVRPWAGVWIAEDIELIHQGIRSGSWIDGSLGTVSAGLDALALVSDPVGALLQCGVAWLIEHVRPLSEALDWLAGDPGQIAGHAQTWRNTAAALAAEAERLASAVRVDVATWTGTAATAYRAWTSEQQQAVVALGKAAETMAAITEGAGFLVAGVRLLVRDAIATCVSRLTVYAAELVATAGLATPLVIEQVTTLVASWAARIARWLRALINSLRALIPLIRRLATLIDELKKILGRLMSAGPPVGKGGGGRQHLLDELKAAGIKHNPDDILHIGRDRLGKIIFLETGNARAGLTHIINRHVDDFGRVGVAEDKIGTLVFAAVTDGAVVGAQRTRPIYEVVFEGRVYRIAVSVGDNGFIVGANPVGH
jgi:uncharacterized protein YukE